MKLPPLPKPLAWGTYAGHPRQVSWTEDQTRAYGDARVAEALKRAIEICEEYSRKHSIMCKDAKSAWAGERSIGAWDCARLIREKRLA